MERKLHIQSPADRESRYAERLRLAAVLSLGIGIVHLMLSPEYLSQWWGYGFFFMLAGLGQMTYGLLLLVLPWFYDDPASFLRDDPPVVRYLYVGGALGYLGVVALFVVTRTLGVPAGPQAGTIAPFSAAGLATTLAEVVLAGLLLALARQARRFELAR
jgi:hypothetical protein